MDFKKDAILQNWQKPRKLSGMQTFIGVRNFYRSFLKSFSATTRLQIRLERKLSRLSVPQKARPRFVAWRRYLLRPLYSHNLSGKSPVLESDVFGYVPARIMSQQLDDRLIRPLAIISKKYSDIECNFKISDIELLAIICCSEEYWKKLERTPSPIKVTTDHQNFYCFPTTKLLDRRHALWAEFLPRFDFHIAYQHGKQEVKPDTLTRRPNNMLNMEDEWPTL